MKIPKTVVVTPAIEGKLRLIKDLGDDTMSGVVEKAIESMLANGPQPQRRNCRVNLSLSSDLLDKIDSDVPRAQWISAALEEYLR